ncbi:uncharacterized protein [Nicotiana tomentosiformis]|uniref:uncharacterized protein n=1 Tax=Nicotiana tomentosiformis TaxID=4098 RepID=UPI00388C3D7D
MIWFDINLGISKGMLVSKDLDLHTCIKLLKSHSLFKGCRFIVDVSQRVFGSTSTFEYVNIETQQGNQDKCQQIMEIDVVEPEPIIEEVLQTFNSIQVEGQSIIEIDNQQALGIQVLENVPVIEEVAEKSSTQLTRRRFLYMFYAYGSSIAGWNHYRPVIAVDATFLKSKYHGILMILISKNANNQIFPLAFGIAESENNNSYEWCKEFDLYMSEIPKVYKKTFDYLIEEPPERWARSCCPRRKYDMLTTNIVESMNSVLLEARELPILRMMDFIQVKLQRWFYERRNEGEGTFMMFHVGFSTLKAFPVDSWRSRDEEEGYTFLLDLNKRTCYCFQFQFDELPSIHAIVAIEKRNIKKFNFCSDCYLKESWLKIYERQRHPVGHTDSWIVPESVKS